MRSLVATLALTCLPLTALAKPWQGMEPGVSTREDVVRRFGKASKTVTSEGRELFAYFGKEGIRGTTQAQFKFDALGKVERIDVFPAPVIDRRTIENSYGVACPAGPLPARPCYLRKITDDFKTYYLYPKLGLAIFFKDDEQSVHSFIFTTPGAAK